MDIKIVILLAVVVILLALAVFSHIRYIMLREYTREVVGRSLKALTRRGVSRKKAVDKICPEMRAELLNHLKSKADKE